MANMLDYLQWRGDLSIERAPLCDVDYLIFSGMSYVPFDGVVGADFSAPVSLGEACKKVHALCAKDGGGRAYHLPDDEKLVSLLSNSERFSSLSLCAYKNVFDEARQEQFCALSVLLPNGDTLIAFRGTDGTLVGWKEDFNMALSSVAPAQKDALSYVEYAASERNGRLHLCGHSKGGNLAVYASAFCGAALQARVAAVRSFDGPGFSDALIAQADFKRIIGRTRTLLPQSSVIGMLLEHAEDFSIVESKSMGIFQHNIYLWQIMRADFLPMSERTNSSYFMDAALKNWVAAMEPSLREKMINGIYSLFSPVEGTRLKDLRSGKNAAAILKSLNGMDDETRQVLSDAFRMLRSSMKSSVPLLLLRAFPGSTGELLCSWLEGHEKKA